MNNSNSWGSIYVRTEYSGQLEQNGISRFDFRRKDDPEKRDKSEVN